MRLALSSAAAPDATLDELLEAAARRGLSAVELIAGHGHGLGSASGSDAAEAARHAAAVGVELAGFRLPDADGGREIPDGEAVAGLGRALAALLLIPCAVDSAGGRSPADAVRLVESLREQGAEALVALPPTDVLAALAAVPHGEAVAWDADPTRGDVAGPGASLLERAGPRLRHIQLRGGGPEATEQEGRGIGSLMARLAVIGYTGTVALAPSSPRYRVIWDAWLGRRGGWGCGSKAEDRTLVSLGGIG